MRSVVICLAPLLLLVACSHQEAFEDAEREISSQDEVIRALRGRNESLLAQQNAREAQLQAVRAERDALLQGNESLDKDLLAMKAHLKSFEKKFGKWDAEFGVRLKAHADGMAFEVADTVLFATGQSALSSRGKEVLAKIAKRIMEHQGKIRVEGHTDNQPVVVHAKEYPKGNLQLSGRRALEVAFFLIKEARLSPASVSYAGYGQYRPLTGNATSEDRARNRRVEIVLLTGS